MERKSPRRANGAGSAVHRADDALSLTTRRPILKAPPAARLRLAALLFQLWPTGLHRVEGENHG